MPSRLPSLSLIIPFLNEEDNLERCLGSIARQTYTKNQLEVILADGGSVDKSREIINRFAADSGIRTVIVDNSLLKGAESGKGLAIATANGDLIQCVDADMWIPDSEMLQTMATTLAASSTLAGAIARYQPFAGMSFISRFLSIDPLQQDPLFQQLTPPIESFVIGEREGYKICSFPTERIPPIGGTTMYRRADINLEHWGGSFLDIDQVVRLIMNGRRDFAYFEQLAWAHDHAKDLSHLIKKRTRNLTQLSNSYLRADVPRDFVWLELSNRKETLRLSRWILGTNLILPRLMEGITQAWRLRRLEPLARPLIAIVVTDALILGILRSPLGRDYLRHLILGHELR